MSARLRRAPARLLSLLTVAVLAASALVTWTVGPAADRAEAASSRTGTAVRYALAQLGDPYRWGAAGPRGFDCSGLTMRAYGAAGVGLPHSSRLQYRSGPKIRRSYWRAGDLVFWASNRKRPRTIYHVAMYLGGSRVVHAPNSGQVVKISRMFDTSRIMRYAVRPTGRYSLGFRPVGSVGNSVRAVQMRLRANGYGVRVSGTFDRATRGAVRTFKLRTGLVANGRVSYAAWSNMVRYGAKTRNG